jgi:hypothetical protein
MDTAYVIGNGESRLIYPIKQIKHKGFIYGCNAIYRDHSDLCDRIVAVNEPMYNELIESKQQGKISPHTELIGMNDISKWNYVINDELPETKPRILKIYRLWTSVNKETGNIKHRDFSNHRGSGCSAVLHAAENGFKNIVIIGFDILGARQWELPTNDLSNLQNNVYKNSPNYDDRTSMKSYLKFEWLFHLTQIFRKFPHTNFYYINRKEYIESNHLLNNYFSYAPDNVKIGIYADLQRIVDGKKNEVVWKKIKTKK